MNSIDDDLALERLCLRSHSRIVDLAVDSTNESTGVVTVAKAKAGRGYSLRLRTTYVSYRGRGINILNK